MPIKYNYPRAMEGDKNRPKIQIKCTNKKDPRIMYFPMPPSVTFNAAGEYSSEDGASFDAGLGTARSFLSKIKGQMGGLLSGGLEDARTARASTVKNPNTITTFKNNGIRSFTFSFTVIPENRDESKDIDDIIKYCTEQCYAENGFGNVLLYPSLWKIEFIAPGEKTNDYLPGIHDCFLTKFDAVYNSEGNIYHDEGQPFMAELSFEFQEEKTLNRENIKELHKQAKVTNNPLKGTKLVQPAKTVATVTPPKTKILNASPSPFPSLSTITKSANGLFK